MGVLLEVQGLKKYFPVTRSLIRHGGTKWIRAVDGIDFTIPEEGTLGLVGESGCGKTTTAKLVLLLERPTEGSIKFLGKDVNKAKGKQLKEYRSLVQAIFQDPYSSLSPRMKIGDFLAEPLEVNRRLAKEDLKRRIKQLLEQVQLDPEAINLYPHEFSGGQRQRIALARALALNPKLVILDEPVSALDVSIRAQIMNLLKDLQEQLGLSYLLIAHNLGTVRYMSHEVAVMYLGKIVERAEADELYSYPLHPYTDALFTAALPSHPNNPRKELPLKGEPPSPLSPPKGCRFHPRCLKVLPVCSEEEPSLKEASPRHFVACFLHSL